MGIVNYYVIQFFKNIRIYYSMVDKDDESGPEDDDPEKAAVTPPARLASCPIPLTPEKTRTPRRVMGGKALFGLLSIDPTTKTYTCKRILAHAGEMLAVPHGSSQPRKKRVAAKADTSINHSDYNTRNIISTSCGAKEKPLVPYNPNAPRSRLHQTAPARGWRNESQIIFGESDVRRFVTNHKNYYRGFSGIVSSNPAITAQKTRWYHYLQVQ